MELITARLPAASIRGELPKIIEWLQGRGIMHVHVRFGFGCALDSDQRLALIPVETIRLSDFYHDAECRGAFAFGGLNESSIYDSAILRLKGDYTSEVRDDLSTTVFTFSHENTINLESNDDQFVEGVRRSWSDRGIKSYRAPDPRFVRGEHGPLPVNNRRFRFTIQDIKHWREIESEAGRPSGLADFYAAHDICGDCRGEGICMIGWSKPIGADELEAAEALQIEELPLYAVCAKCGGSGKPVR